MDKTFGEKKYKYIHKNKLNKQKYSDHRNKTQLHKPLRNYVNSYINHNKHDLEDFFFPSISPNTYNRWGRQTIKTQGIIIN